MQEISKSGQENHSGLTLNEDVSDEIIDLYVSLVPGYLDELVTARAEHDFKSMNFHAHKLASVMGVMGFQELNRLLIRIEHEGMNEDLLNESLEIVSCGVKESLELIKEVKG